MPDEQGYSIQELEQLFQLLNDEDEEKRRKAFLELSNIGSPILPFLVRSLELFAARVAQIQYSLAELFAATKEFGINTLLGLLESEKEHLYHSVLLIFTQILVNAKLNLEEIFPVSTEEDLEYAKILLEIYSGVPKIIEEQMERISDIYFSLLSKPQLPVEVHRHVVISLIFLFTKGYATQNTRKRVVEFLIQLFRAIDDIERQLLLITAFSEIKVVEAIPALTERLKNSILDEYLAEYIGNAIEKLS